MLVFAENTHLEKRHQGYVISAGSFDWIPNLSHALGSAGNLVSANEDTFKNVADVVRSVATAGTTTPSAVKQIVDAVKAEPHNRIRR